MTQDITLPPQWLPIKKLLAIWAATRGDGTLLLLGDRLHPFIPGLLENIQVSPLLAIVSDEASLQAAQQSAVDIRFSAYIQPRDKFIREVNDQRFSFILLESSNSEQIHACLQLIAPKGLLVVLADQPLVEAAIDSSQWQSVLLQDNQVLLATHQPTKPKRSGGRRAKS